MTSQNKLLNEDIDLSGLITITWKNKLKIFLTIVIVLLIGIFSKINSKVSEELFLAKTDILPISTFDDYQYSAFNTYLIKMRKNDTLSILSTQTNTQTDEIFRNSISYSTYLNHIDKFYLYDLFLEKLNQEDLLKKGIKKFNFVKKENFPDNKSYEEAVTKLASSIEILTKSGNNSQYIQFKTNSKKVWEDFLIYIENSANAEIQDYIKTNFNLFLINAERLKKYTIEDIAFEIENNLDNELISNRLEKIKKRTEENKDVKRLKDIFENTPIVKSNNFTAARFNIPLSTYKGDYIENYSMKKTIIISILLGLILGIIYVLIESKIKKKI
jgi:hypothetical protein